MEVIGRETCQRLGQSYYTKTSGASHEMGPHLYIGHPLNSYEVLLPVQTFLVSRPRRLNSPSNNAGTRIRHHSRDTIGPPLCQRSFNFGKAVISNFSGMPFR